MYLPPHSHSLPSVLSNGFILFVLGWPVNPKESGIAHSAQRKDLDTDQANPETWPSPPPSLPPPKHTLVEY